MAVSRDDVVETALGLLHEGGLEAVTFRAIASRLGVSAPTLLWHVKDKRALLDLMAARIGEREAAAAPGAAAEGDAADPVARLGRAMRGYRERLLETPDGARIVAGNRPTADTLGYIEGQLETLTGAGLEPGEALQTMLAIGTFVLGDALETQESRRRGASARPGDDVVEAMRSGAYPNLAAAATHFRGDFDTLRFEIGLGLMLEGVRARLAALSRS